MVLLRCRKPPVSCRVVILASLCSGLVGLSLAAPALAIEVAPNAAQVETVMEQGREFAKERIPPDRLYFWFGADDELHPRGFILTKLVGLRVLAAHFALRGETPSDDDIHQLLDATSFLVTVQLFGARPNFAVNSYVVLEQGGASIKPINVRFDAVASRTSVWPKPPAYRAKVVAVFNYADLDPHAKATLSIYPQEGGEVRFELDLSEIE